MLLVIVFASWGWRWKVGTFPFPPNVGVSLGLLGLEERLRRRFFFLAGAILFEVDIMRIAMQKVQCVALPPIRPYLKYMFLIGM